jgi:hypothetical protein
VRSHTGYRFDEQDVRDMTQLREHFGIELPPGYGGPGSP